MSNFFKRLLAFEPTMVRAVLAAVATATLAFGLDLSDAFGRVDVAWTALFGIVPILQGLLTRPAVTPNAKVEARTDEIAPSGEDYSDWTDSY